MGDIYLGKQGTIGLGMGDDLNTVVTPTRLISYSTSGFNRFNPKDRFPNRKGRPTTSGRPYRPRSMSDMTQVPLGGQLDLNDFIMVLLAAVDGNPTIAKVPELEESYDWVWMPDGRAIPPTKFATMQWREQDASETAQVKTFQAHKGMCQSFSLSAQGVTMASFQAQFQLGIRQLLAAPTSGLPSEELIPVPVKRTTMSIYDSWDEMVAAVPEATDSLQYSVGYQAGLKPLQRRDGVMDYGRAESDMRGLTMGMMIYNEHGTNALAAIEDDHRDEDTLRFVKMRFASNDAIETRSHWVITRRSATAITARPTAGSITGTTLTPPTGYSLAKPTGSDQLYVVDAYEDDSGNPQYSLPRAVEDTDTVGYQGVVDITYILEVGMAADHTDQSLQQRGQTTDGDFSSLGMNFELATDIEENREVYFRIRTAKTTIDDYLDP